ncbi:MAG: septal ring lytic transglycosylase RlpA family protein [Acidobacteriota bacterium]|nr:septal ring lytic transglycosylase RlpA family protein [Acidobacteriota bacterium]
MTRAEMQWPARILAGWSGLALVLLVVTGCGHHKTTTQLSAPQTAPPEIQASAPEAEQPAPAPQPPVETGRIPITPMPHGGISDEDLDYIATHQPILSEEGDATWYTARKGRRAANGQVFSNRALTAAHRTLPMGSLIVVTNLENGQSAAMRISDRGPFAPDKVIDLTIASAKATGVYRMGVARVRIDVYRTPKPIDEGGRWCVQIGAFNSERKAEKLKKQLLRKYPGAHVIDFAGEHSYWVRIRPEGDNREVAESIARHVHPSQGDAYLTRLD